MDLTSFHEIVCSFLHSSSLLPVGALSPGPDDDLFETGLLDSQVFLQLVLHLEARTGAQIDITMAEPEDFSTIRGLFQLTQTANLGPDLSAPHD
jgi:acyl carrier protein